MTTQIDKVEVFKKALIANMLDEYNTQHGADGRFAGSGAGAGVGGFGNTVKGKDNRAPDKEPVNDQKTADDFVAGLGDINLETEAGVQKFHDAKNEFLKEQGVKDNDIQRLNGNMEEFAANATGVGAVEMARMNNRLNGAPEMSGIRTSDYIPAKEYKTSISASTMKAYELNVQVNQAMLKSKFGNELTLHRGIVQRQAREAINSAKNGKVNLEVGAVSSWSQKASVAQSFASSSVSGVNWMDKMKGSDKASGVVISSTFKVSNVVDSHFTNPRLFKMQESEVVIGGIKGVVRANLSTHTLSKNTSADVSVW